MEFNLTLLISLGGLAIGLLTLAGTGWWRMTVMVKDARNEGAQAAAEVRAMASLALREVAEHRLHTAEQYVSKSNLREVTDQIMEAISGVGTQISEMRSRIDRVFEKPPAARPTRA